MKKPFFLYLSLLFFITCVAEKPREKKELISKEAQAGIEKTGGKKELIPKEAQAEIEKPREKKELISKEARAGIEKTVNNALNEGVVKKLDIQLERAWIDDSIWALCNAEIKENIAKALSMYCAIKKNQEYGTIEILGWQSGKKLASYSPLRGFKVY